MPEEHQWVIELARSAGRAILAVYETDFSVDTKSDESPLTKADLAAHRIISAGLAEQDPGTPVISEEAGLEDFSVRGQWQRYWLVDPLDGTKEFVKRNGEFTVNIALIEQHRPVLGIVHVPVRNVTYVGIPGSGAWRQDADQAPTAIQVSDETPATARVVGSRSHQSDAIAQWLARIGEHEIIAMGSSLKFCVVAEGGADVYPRLGLTSEWDTGAAQAVVEAAGGSVLTLDGQALAYNRKDDILNPYFVVVGSRSRDWLAATEGLDAKP
ncbi:MAG: 3'(2'),5'-bisphosphate nucleotidase CysQ [Pseudomonadota bacterium]